MLIATIASAQSARQFLDSAGKPISRGTLTLYRLGSKRTVKLDRDGQASVQLDFRDALIALRDHKGRVVATYNVIWTAPGRYRISAQGCAGYACWLDQTTNIFPVRKPQ